MATKMKFVSFPPRFTNSLRQLGRLDPSGRLIFDDCTSEGGLRQATTVENVEFQPLDLGYLGKFCVVTDAYGSSLKGAHVAKAQLRSLEKIAAERAASDHKAVVGTDVLVDLVLGLIGIGPLPLADTHPVSVEA